MRVAIPLQGGTQWMGGFYYARTVARALATEHVPIWLVPASERDVSLSLEREGACIHRYQTSAAWVRKVGHLVGHRNPSVERAAKAARADLVFPTTSSLGWRTSVPFVGWIADFQHVHLPELFTHAERKARDRAMARIATEASRVVLSSGHALSTFVERYPAHAHKAHALQFPAIAEASWYEGEPEAVFAKYGIERHFVYLPNQFWIHKNHEVVFRAWALLGERAPQLVCSGHPEDPRRPGHFEALREILAAGGVANRVRFLGLVPRADQIQLYRAAGAVLNPSKYEGWSSTVEEARTLGKKLILSKIPIFLEQGPPGSQFFDANDPATLASIVEELAGERTGYDAEAERRARMAAEERFRAYVLIVNRILGEVQPLN